MTLRAFVPAVLSLSIPLLACDSEPSDADDDGDGETGSQDDDDDDEADDDEADDDDSADTSAGDEDPTDPSADDTGTDTGIEPGTPIDDGVFFYVREIDTTVDEVWSYDLATDTTQRVLAADDGGVAEVSSIAIHPDRTWIAVATTWNTTHYQQSENIFGFAAGEGATLGEPSLLLEGLPAPVGASSGYSQQIDDLRFQPDGSALWLGHSFAFDISDPGGGVIASLDLGSGELTLHDEIVDDCTVNSGPSPSPDGGALFVVQGVCTEEAHEGIVGFDLPLGGASQQVLTAPNIGFATPRWTPDGAGITYYDEIDWDSDGDGMGDIFGHALMLLDLAEGTQYALLPPAPNQYFWDFTMSPDGTRFVMCVNHEDQRDLLLVDYSGDEATTRWLTNDGVSCKPSW